MYVSFSGRPHLKIPPQIRVKSYPKLASELTATICVIGARKKHLNSTYPVSDWLRPAVRPADYFWKNAYETRGGPAGPPLPTSSLPKGWKLGLGLGSGWVWADVQNRSARWCTVFFLHTHNANRVARIRIWVSMLARHGRQQEAW